MIRHATWPALAAAGFAALLAGCSHPPMPAPPGVPHISPATMIEAIRAARAADKSVIQVTPLRDPAVDGYLHGARADENAGKYKSALARIDEALKLSPEAPDILQSRAEAEILLHDFPAAAADARRSFALGPKLGGLCASNWQTLLEIAQSQNDQAGVAAARSERDKCVKAPPPSF